MRELLKADLKRAVKDKLFLVLIIIAGVFAVLIPLIYKALFSLVNLEEMQEIEMLGLQINAKTMFFSAFSPGSNFGLVLPIMVAIILCKDFSGGTVRNKIICGKSRGSIYLSMLLTCIILMCAFILVQALLTLLVSLLFFAYQPGGFTAGDFGYLMASIGFEMLTYVFLCAFLTFLIVFMKNAGLAIVIYFVTNFMMTIVGAITQTVVALVDPASVAHGILEFANTANVFATTAIGTGTGYGLKEVLSLLLPNVALIALFAFSGWSVFRKKDLK